MDLSFGMSCWTFWNSLLIAKECLVVKDGQTGKIHLLSKGADEAILPRAYPGNGTTMKSALCHHSSNIEFSQIAWILNALSDKLCIL